MESKKYFKLYKKWKFLKTLFLSLFWIFLIPFPIIMFLDSIFKRSGFNPYMLLYIVISILSIAICYIFNIHFRRKIWRTIGALPFVLEDKFDLLCNFKIKIVRKNINILNRAISAKNLNYVLYDESFTPDMNNYILISFQEYFKSIPDPFCTISFNARIENIDEIKSDLVEVIEIDQFNYKFVFKKEDLDYYKFLVWLQSADINKIETNDIILNELIKHNRIKANEYALIDVIEWQNTIKKASV